MRKLNFLDNLIQVHRYSGNLLVKDESVSDHVWSMISLALEYVPYLNLSVKSTEDSDNYIFKLEDIIFGISVHDLDEALTGDVPRNFKYHNKYILDAVKVTSDQILLDYVGRDLYDKIKKSIDKSSPNGLLIKIFDVAQAGYKMLSEIQLGNRYFINELENVFECMNGLKNQVNDLNCIPSAKFKLLWMINEFIIDFEVTVKNNHVNLNK